jgi:hypothetical protein
VHDGDCTTVAIGCYCGQQPVVGVAKTFGSAAAACEAKSAATCARGCANFPGQMAEDGRSSSDGTITVHCIAGDGGLVCRSYVP